MTIKNMVFLNDENIDSFENKMTVTYRAYLNGFIELNKIPAGKDFIIHFNVELWHEPIEYIALIRGRLEVPRNNVMKLIHGSFDLKGTTINKDIDGIVNIEKKEYQPLYILGSLEFNDPGKIEKELPGLLYIYREKFENDFEINFTVPTLGNYNLLNGIVSLSKNNIQNDLPIFFNINGKTCTAFIDGTVSLCRNIYSNSQLITGELNYVRMKLDKEVLFGFFNVDDHKLDCLFPISFKVKSAKYIYSLFIRFRVVSPKSKEMNIRFSVSNTQIYDIWGYLDVPLAKQTTNLLEGSCYLPPYKTAEIDGSLYVDGTYTRRDMQIYFYASTPVNEEMGINFKVCNIFNRYGVCMQLNFEVIRPRIITDFNLFFRTKEADRIDKYLKIRFRVDNILSPLRIAIVGDPLWRYQPFLVKSCVVGLFDRITTKNEVTVVYGGNPRFDYDIEHFAKIFGIRKLINSPLLYDAKNPGITKHFTKQFIDAMFMFNDRKHEPHRVDKVFIFMNRPLQYQNNISIAPIIKICKECNIPCVCIDSGGNFITINDNCHYPHHYPSFELPTSDVNWGCGECDCDHNKIVY